MQRIQSVRACFATVLSVVGVIGVIDLTAHAQGYPEKQINLVVPYSAGATLDTIARKVAEELAGDLGQPVIIDNRPGADGQIGLDYVANRSAADGYTFMIASVPGMALLPLTAESLQFDPLADFDLFLAIGEGRYVLGSSADHPWTDVEELASHAAQEGSRLLYGASNPAARFWSEEFLRELEIDAVNVPYKEGGVYIQAVGRGEVSMGFIGEMSAISLGDRFRALAVTGAARSQDFPDAPTFAELGMDQMRGTLYAFGAARGTPAEIVDVLRNAASTAMQKPAVREAFDTFRIEIVDPAVDANAELREQNQMFSRLAGKPD